MIARTISLLFDGFAYGMLLFVLSVGLSVTLGMMNFVNLAHGTFAMIGGYTTVMLMRTAGWPFFATLPVAFLLAAACALAELGEPNVSRMAEFEPGRNEHAVDIEARLALEFKQHGHRSGVAGAPAQNPSPAAEDAAGEHLHQPRGLLGGNGFHLQRPREARGSS